MQGDQGFDRPCRARPADRSLVAEDRSARGVRDRTGPKDAAAPRSRLANDAVVTEGRPHPAAKLRANGATGYRVILTGRATGGPSLRCFDKMSRLVWQRLRCGLELNRPK